MHACTHAWREARALQWANSNVRANVRAASGAADRTPIDRAGPRASASATPHAHDNRGPYDYISFHLHHGHRSLVRVVRAKSPFECSLASNVISVADHLSVFSDFSVSGPTLSLCQKEDLGEGAG
jgi:hypothetical protein